MPDPFIHIHIMRTGGTTLQATLDARYPGATCRIHTERDFDAIGDFSRFKMIQGHFGWGVHEWSRTEPKYFTFLRHPVRRVSSLFCHGKTPQQMLGAIEDAKNEPHSAEHIGGMVMQIGGYAPDIANWYMQVPTRDDLERAKQHLLDMVFVGFTSYYEQSIRELSRITDWDLSNIVNKDRTENPIPYPRPGDETYEAIKIRHPLGFELYEWASSQFLHKIV